MFILGELDLNASPCYMPSFRREDGQETPKLKDFFERPTSVAEAREIRLAVLVPCYNEELTVARVVTDFTAALPGAVVYVYDNNSCDRTVEVARAAGVVVRSEPLQGKGHVVRRMFADVEADVYVLVDGDATYDAASARRMVALLRQEQLDMVVGARLDSDVAAYRPGHRFGNAMLTWFVARLFGKRFTDMLSGYRVFSRRFVKSFPSLSTGFEIETELTVHALELSLPVAEVGTPYGARLEGSASKLRTYSDGLKIARLIVVLFKNERPLQFFGLLAAVFAVLSVGVGIPVIVSYVEAGLVPKLPSAVLATGLALLAALSLVTGLVLDTVTRGRREMKRLAYLHEPGPTGA